MQAVSSTAETPLCFYETTRPHILEGCHLQINNLFHASRLVYPTGADKMKFVEVLAWLSHTKFS
jgi:hypothetical protein